MKKLIEKMRADLSARRHEWRKISEYAGVHYTWIAKFENGTITNPTVDTLDRVQKALDNI